MSKHLTRIGNSYAAVIPRPIMAMLGIDAKTEIEFHTDGKSLTIVPKRAPGHDAAVMEAAGKIIRRHRKALLKLAE